VGVRQRVRAVGVHLHPLHDVINLRTRRAIRHLVHRQVDVAQLTLYDLFGSDLDDVLRVVVLQHGGCLQYHGGYDEYP
ncbi:MAG: hypothetical protein IJ776_06865, partial [Paludibacteraceae bacterium]|nr:hypothetical protein [Paludibacteraceae bacterium]